MMDRDPPKAGESLRQENSVSEALEEALKLDIYYI